MLKLPLPLLVLSEAAAAHLQACDDCAELLCLATIDVLEVTPAPIIHLQLVEGDGGTVVSRRLPYERHRVLHTTTAHAVYHQGAAHLVH
jgi:hypothetical protein